MQSASMNIAAVFTGVWVDTCVRACVCGLVLMVRLTAHQLLFDYSCRGSGTMSVIRRRYTHTYNPLYKNPHLVSVMGRQMI